MPPTLKNLPKKQHVPAPTAPAVEADPTPGKPFVYETVGKLAEAEPAAMQPPYEAPQGLYWVFNRLQEPYSIPFDSRLHTWKPNEFKLYDRDMSYWMANNSIFQFSRNKAIRALVIEPKKGFGVPFSKDVTAKTPEMIDRYGDPNPLGRGTQGIPTTPKLVRV